MRRLASLCLFAVLLALHAVQAQESSTSHQHGQTRVIDGSVHPDQIPDLTAYRLYLLSISTSATPSEIEKKKQGLRISMLGLPDTEREALLRVIANFRAEHDRLVKDYNERATEANARGENYDLTPLLQQLGQLTQSTQGTLRNMLNKTTWDHLDQRVQSEKVKMKIQTGVK